MSLALDAYRSEVEKLAQALLCFQAQNEFVFAWRPIGCGRVDFGNADSLAVEFEGVPIDDDRGHFPRARNGNPATKMHVARRAFVFVSASIQFVPLRPAAFVSL